MTNLARISVFISTAIEVFDLSIFAFLIPVLSSVFFSSHSQSSAINFTILAYVVSYAVKPFSGMVFGYLSDSYGRKQVLSVTTLLMTVSTAVIGLLPTSLPGIDLWVALFSCRIIQGLSISGEFSNGLIFAVEQGKDRPAFSGSMAFMGGILGLLLANISVFVLLNFLPYEQMIQYGWRIPFLISAFIWLALYQIRRFINEPFVQKRNDTNHFSTLVRKYRKELVICFVAASLSASAFYMTFVYMPTLLSSVIQNQTHHESVWVTLVALSVYFVCLPLSGSLADRVGITKQITTASALYLLFSYVCFDYISHFNYVVIFCSLILLALIQSLYNSALPAFMVSLFPAIHRGKALAISYNTSLSIFGGLMPYVILSHKSFMNPGIVISICAILTLVVLRFVRE
ncbi:MFS transporter [Legionella pneumophila]|uniref:MFS transporter n=1 Tax=Legionella pneumophila TaxID=446 RepID=UPI00224495C0|nr:MFS transporter [Legionella pneumophila]MCW8436840.1 MFS transporter [Legionella pneumophila]MCW8479192.1 MFS transporter [Legionella pneumophila]HDV5709458.1 MFS transporter [Legionella pneumophila]HDV5805220.1 MFS transporter [Legionella pneumophila]